MVALRSTSRPTLPSSPPSVTPAAVLAVVPPPEHEGFGPVLDFLVEDGWRRVVAERAPSEVLRAPYLRKIRAGFATYAPLGISAVVCARGRPRALDVTATGARLLRLPAPAIAALGCRTLPQLLRLACGEALDRVALASFLILGLDELLDDRLAHLPPRVRADALRALVRDRVVPEGEPLGAFCVALLDEWQAKARGAESEQLGPLLEDLAGWAYDEVALETGEDMSGPPRQRGIEVSMRMLACATARWVGEAELHWMIRIAELGQRLDDLLDLEKDLAVGRRTLAASGEWTLPQAEALYATLVEETRALVNEPYAPIAWLFEQTFRRQLRKMAEILTANP
ncbi:MAG: hypothetical protein HYS27_16565 [Deltaproteobacteria bacterium]|nr:hypothetical protein [Deltaproteobacteria bacterium]